jgi:alcohol dehydrogenase (cytochrome c)
LDALVAMTVVAGCSKLPVKRPPAAPAQPAQPEATRTRTIDWPTYNNTLTGERFSPVQGLTPTSVAGLQRVCAYDTGKDISAQTGPLVLGGTIYFTDDETTYAVDGATCKERWRHTRTVEPKGALRNNHGVAYLEGRLYRGYADGHVLAIDARTGNVVWDVKLADPTRGETIPMAPIAWNGLVFVGNAGGDMFGVTGHVFALAARDGRIAWRFDTVPSSPEVTPTWPLASALNPPTGGAVWTTFSLDPSDGVLYVTTGNAAPDFVLSLRQGKALYTNSVLALDARGGKLLAYVQPIGDDQHDHDVAAAPALITTRSGRHLALTAAKNGIAYGIEARQLRDDQAALVVAYQVETTTRDNLETPLSSTVPVRFCPGTQGGTEWNGPAYNPDLNLAFVGAVDWCTTVKLQPIDQLLGQGKPGMSWSGSDDPKNPFGVMDPPAAWRGWLTAFDADTGAVRWKYQAPAPILAAVTATAGGVVFTGDLAGMLRAFEAATGRVLWEDRAGNAMGGGIVTYAIDDRPYVAAVTGQPSPIWPVDAKRTAQLVIYAPTGAPGAAAPRPAP